MNEEERNNIEMLKKFMIEHYASMDFTHWVKKIKYNADKLVALKTSRGKQGYLTELYSAYIQLTEVLLTNILIASNKESRILTNLFVPNNKLRDFFEACKDKPDFFEWFLNNYDFGIEQKDKINNFQKKYDEHESILKEVIEDYFEDYEFLNAYKHGYRVRSSSEDHSFTYVTNEGKRVSLDTYDSLLIYLSREKDTENRGKYIIYEKTIALKIPRVVIKAFFITSMLNNIKAVLSAQAQPNKKINITHYFFDDKAIWNKSFGTARISKELFIMLS